MRRSAKADPGGLVEVTVEERSVTVGGVAVELVDGIYPPYREVVPGPQTGSQHIVKDSGRLAKVLRGHVATLVDREAADREVKAPACKEAREKLAQARKAFKGLLATQKAERDALRVRIKAATDKAERKRLRAELRVQQEEHTVAVGKASDGVRALADAVDAGGWEVGPSSVLTVAQGKGWRLSTRDSNAPESESIVEEIGQDLVTPGDAITIGVNPAFLAAALGSVKGLAEVRLNGEHSPVVIRGRAKGLEITLLVMPINLR